MENGSKNWKVKESTAVYGISQGWKFNRYMLAAAGFIGAWAGTLGSIVSFVKEDLWLAAVFSAIMVTGLILLAIAFND